MKPKVSIIVPVYNEEKTLPLCLDSLMNLDFPRDDLEIIVVDNNSSDATQDIIRHYPVKYVFESKKSRGAARNKGINESRGELIAFIDADCVADRLWVANIINGFATENIGGCGGEILSYKPQSLLEKYYDLKHIYSQERCLRAEKLYFPILATFNAVYRRNVLKEVGLFDDFFIAHEDIDLSWRVYLKGYQLNYIPEALVYHIHSNRLADFYRRFFEHGYAFTYLLQKYTNLIQCPLFSYDVCAKFLFQLLHSTNTFFTTIFTGKDKLRRIFPIFDIIKEGAFFLGRIYGLLNLALRTKEIIPQLNPDNVIWRIGRIVNNDEAIILDFNKDCHYILNKIGTTIWTLLLEGKDLPDIIDIITAEYDADKEEVKNDIVGFIDELKREGLLLTDRLKFPYYKKSNI